MLDTILFHWEVSSANGPVKAVVSVPKVLKMVYTLRGMVLERGKPSPLGSWKRCLRPKWGACTKEDIS